MSATNHTMTNQDWDRLLMRIKAGKCTPFLGAGAAMGYLPTGSTIAETWAESFNYPLVDRENLVQVAQYLAVENDAMFPKEELLNNWFTNLRSPDFRQLNEPHGVLASLPLPIFITTNYDNFMYRALDEYRDKNGRKTKTPVREVCRWNRLIEKKLHRKPSVFDDFEFTATPEAPVVFHLHGYDEMPESLVLTEDDYIDFLVRISQGDSGVIPPRIQEAIADTSLLFVGYSLNDLNFRVLFRGIINSIERTTGRDSFTLQFPPPPDQASLRYIENYFDKMSIKVVWGDASDFVAELLEKWEAYNQ